MKNLPASLIRVIQRIYICCGSVPEETLAGGSSNSDMKIDCYLIVGHTTKNIIGMLIFFAERRDDYFPSYRRKTIFCFSSTLIYSYVVTIVFTYLCICCNNRQSRNDCREWTAWMWKPQGPSY